MATHNELHLAPGWCEKAHFSLNPPVFVVGIDLTDRGNSQKVRVLLVIHHTHTHTHTACDTAPNSTPPTQTNSHRSDYTALTLPVLPQYKSDFSREHTALLDYNHPSQEEYSLTTEQRKAPQSKAAWGAACHVSPSITLDSPARVLYAETGKNNPTCSGILTVLVS